MGSGIFEDVVTFGAGVELNGKFGIRMAEWDDFDDRWFD